MIENIEILKVDLKSCLDTIEDVNPNFYDNIYTIYKNLPKEQQYVYHMTIPYGKQLIRNSKFILFDQYETPNDIKISNQFNDQELSLNQIKNDFGNDIDFPLSLVLENLVEIFMQRKFDSFYHKIPLDIINKGEFFGIWGVFDQLEGVRKVDAKQNWDGTAGRSCYLTFFKDYPQQKTRPGVTDKIFEWLFYKDSDRKEPLDADKAIQKFIRENISESETKILCFPKHYYLNDKELNEQDNCHKNTFLLKMFQEQWYKTRTERGVFWKNLQLKLELEEKFDLTALDIQAINHIINIITGKDFYLRPISKEDSIEFKAYSLMIEKMKDLKFTKGNCPKLRIKNASVKVKDKSLSISKLIDNAFQAYTPYFMYYQRAEKNDSNVFISFLKSPLTMSLFYYNSKKNKLNTDWEKSKISSIEKVIKKHTGINITLNILKDIRKDSEVFVNTYVGRKSSEFALEKPFEHIELMSMNENMREFFSESKKNLPFLFKQYPIHIKIIE